MADYLMLQAMQAPLPPPGQTGAPLFKGSNATEFMEQWETLTIGWLDKPRILRLAGYCERTLGKCVRELPEYKEGKSWDEFKKAFLKEFKDVDVERERYTTAYLKGLATKLQAKKLPSKAEIRGYIYEFSEISAEMIEWEVISGLDRIRIFLSGLPFKIGNRLCKEHDIDPTEPTTAKNKWEDLRKSALKYSASEETPMDLFRKAHQMDGPAPGEPSAPRTILQRSAESKARPDRDVDELAKILSDLRIQQLEAQQQMTQQFQQLLQQH